MTFSSSNFTMNDSSSPSPISFYVNLCEQLKAKIPNYTDANCSEFLTLNVHNITSTSPPPTPIPDKCIDYCDHAIRTVMNDYKNYYHGYTTLIVS